jgi:hypothetical protein
MDKGDRKLWKRVSKVIEQAIMELGKTVKLTICF